MNDTAKKPSPIVVETVEETNTASEIFANAVELFPAQMQQQQRTAQQRYPLQTGSWVNNVAPALATVVGTHSNTTKSNELPPLTQSQSKSKTKKG